MTGSRGAIRRFYDKIRILSLRAALREQGLHSMCRDLELIVPEIRHQYTGSEIATDYHRLKVRALHAFQVSLIDRAIARVKRLDGAPITIVDIGDSSGTHMLYTRGRHPKICSLSVNLDAAAVERICAKGLKAIHGRAEDLKAYSVDADLLLSFETVEHLLDPVVFLERLSRKSSCRALVVTVPYRATSRVALTHIRTGQRQGLRAEGVHIFELSPEDWRLVFMHCGWRVAEESIYLQYPKRHPLRVMKWVWKRKDHEGFYGVILERDQTWRDVYMDWQPDDV